jgi:hypothetical protein
MRLGAAALAVLLIAALAACYVPDKFYAELRMSRFGDYQLDFKGDMIYMPIQHDYAGGKIKPQDEAERQENIRKDMSRDPAFKTITALGRGRFNVTYSRQGRLGKEHLVALIRRDSRMLAMKSSPDNRITIVASSVKPTDADTMGKLGVSMQGEFRLTTDANVVEHNATEERRMGNFKVYIWKIENVLSPVPRITIIRDVDPNRPLE